MDVRKLPNNNRHINYSLKIHILLNQSLSSQQSLYWINYKFVNLFYCHIKSCSEQLKVLLANVQASPCKGDWHHYEDYFEFHNKGHTSNMNL